VDILEQTDEAVISTGDVDMEPAKFGSVPKTDRNRCRAGFERSGAESIVFTGKLVI
jgi:hypothetical protein